MEDWLLAWIKSRNPGVELNKDENYFELGLIDSYGLIELIEDIERQLNIKLKQDDLTNPQFFTISGLAKILHSRN